MTLAGFSILVELEFRVLVFVVGAKPENQEINPQSKSSSTHDKLNHVHRRPLSTHTTLLSLFPLTEDQKFCVA